jgi:uncharacterized protein (TIGR02271 family)
MTDRGRREGIELIEEQLEVRKRQIERDRVVIRTSVEERDEVAEAALRQEDVVVERVPIGRVVPELPPIREEGGTLIIPLVEERLVIRKELVLREEIWITKTSRTEVVRTPVRLKAERAEVEQTSNLNSSDQRIADHE